MSEVSTKPTWIRLVDLIRTFLTWAGTSPPPATKPPDPPQPVPVPVETNGQRLLTKHNEYRENHGRRPLVWNATLGSLAAKQADAMARARRLSHEIGGASFPARLGAQKSLKYRSAAENIAEAGSVDAAFKAWLGSPPHQASILNGNLTAMGAAAANTDGDVPGRYWCVIFIQEVAPGQFTTAGLVHTMPLGVKGEGCHD